MLGHRQGGKPVELIVEDADFVTMTPASRAESMLVRDGRITAIGPAAAVRAAAEPGAAVVRLDGATVIPGLIDAHCHVMDVGYLAAGADCGQPSAPDIPAIQARLREAANGTPAQSWVTGSGYVEYKLAEQRHPTRADLDAAVPDRPAVIYHTSLHACVLNSAALREAGFADGQPDPPDGVFGRDGQGRLTGVLFEGPMFAVFAGRLRHDLAHMDPAARARVVGRAGQRLAALGITAACDADMRCQTFAAYAEADDAGVLAQRVYGLTVHDEVDTLVKSGLRGRRSGRLAAQAVKIWADGGMSSRTAAITEPTRCHRSARGSCTSSRPSSPRWCEISRPAASRSAFTPKATGRSRSCWTRMRKRWPRRRETRAGTASSTAAPCTRRSPRERRDSGYRW
jgi:hypothetical protein